MATKQHFEGVADAKRIQYIFPALIISSFKLAKRYDRYSEQDKDESWHKKTSTLYRFIHQIIMILYRHSEEANCVQYFEMAAQIADMSGLNDIANDFYLDSFKIYEESVADSNKQYNAIVFSIGSLLTTRSLSVEQYNTLCTKVTLYSSKLMKKPDQSRCIYHAAHLWFPPEEAMLPRLANNSNNDDETGDKEDNGDIKQGYRNDTRVLECLQKSLKIADSCIDIMTNTILFLEITEQYIYYFDKENKVVSYIK